MVKRTGRKVSYMEISKFHTTQADLANTLKIVIDSYMESEIKEEEMVESVVDLITLNTDKYYAKGTDEVAYKVKALLGVKRLSLVKKVLRQVGK
jgi:uncharacterized protein (TIGR04540 family)